MRHKEHIGGDRPILTLCIFIKDTYRGKLCFTQFQEFIDAEAWLFLTFFILLNNQLSYKRSIVGSGIPELKNRVEKPSYGL